MKIFLVALLISTLASFGLWHSGIAQVFWPAHPLVATTLLAGFCGAVTEVLLTPNAARASARK